MSDDNKEPLKLPPEALVDPDGLRIRGEDEVTPGSQPNLPPESNQPPADDPELMKKLEREKMEKEFGDEDDDDDDAQKPDDVSDKEKKEEASDDNGDAADEPEDNDAGNEAKETPEEAAAREAEEAKLADDATDVMWESTGSLAGDAVLDMLKNADVSKDEARAMLYDAIAEGDPSKIDTAALKEKLGASQAYAAEQTLRAFITERATLAAEAVKETHEIVGGEEAWDKVRDWVNDPANMSPDQLGEYAKMIDAGGAQRRFAITEMKAAYEADSNNSDLANSREEPTEAASAPPAVEPISKTEYADQYDKVYNDRSLSPKMRERKLAQLNAARAAGRAANI